MKKEREKGEKEESVSKTKKKLQENGEEGKVKWEKGKEELGRETGTSRNLSTSLVAA